MRFPAVCQRISKSKGTSCPAPTYRTTFRVLPVMPAAQLLRHEEEVEYLVHDFRRHAGARIADGQLHIKDVFIPSCIQRHPPKGATRQVATRQSNMEPGAPPVVAQIAPTKMGRRWGDSVSADLIRAA